MDGSDTGGSDVAKEGGERMETVLGSPPQAGSDRLSGRVPPRPEGAPRTVSSEALLGGDRELVILPGAARYPPRLTSPGQLHPMQCGPATARRAAPAAGGP